MSTEKKEFLCIIPDKPGALPIRLEVRRTHLANLKPLVETATIVSGGVFFDGEHPADGEAPKFAGSSVIIVAESAEKAKEILSKDIYTEMGVWDLGKAQILPFQSAVRLPIS